MEITNPNHNEGESNTNLITRDITLDDLKVYLRLRFRSYKEAAVGAGISEGRVRQIIIGYDVPKTPELIYQIARGWNIDPVKLALLFENVQNKKLDEEVRRKDEQKDVAR